MPPPTNTNTNKGFPWHIFGITVVSLAASIAINAVFMMSLNSYKCSQTKDSQDQVMKIVSLETNLNGFLLFGLAFASLVMTYHIVDSSFKESASSGIATFIFGCACWYYGLFVVRDLIFPDSTECSKTSLNVISQSMGVVYLYAIVFVALKQIMYHMYQKIFERCSSIRISLNL